MKSKGTFFLTTGVRAFVPLCVFFSVCESRHYYWPSVSASDPFQRFFSPSGRWFTHTHALISVQVEM